MLLINVYKALHPLAIIGRDRTPRHPGFFAMPSTIDSKFVTLGDPSTMIIEIPQKDIVQKCNRTFLQSALPLCHDARVHNC
jgi:hypothetical protein